MDTNCRGWKAGNLFASIPRRVPAALTGKTASDSVAQFTRKSVKAGNDGLTVPDLHTLLNSQVLVLNRLWQAVNICSARGAFSLVYAGHAQIVSSDAANNFFTH